MSSPLIFIHFGNSEYLQYTLRCAKHFNPNKRIILLGDSTNNKYSSIGIEHHSINAYEYGDKLDKFNTLYRFIGGRLAKESKWMKFVFQRWFIIYNFIISNKIQSFWTMDSDNLILTDLEKFEPYFQHFDCTEQCESKCMNGYISHQNVVEGYLDKMIELFTREDYLEKQRNDFLQHPTWAYTEMRAYETYKEEENITTVSLSKVIENSTFDSNITFSHGMEMNTYTVQGGSKIKSLYYHPSGELYTYHIKSQSYIKLNSINCSWVPLNVFIVLTNAALYQKLKPHKATKGTMVKLNLKTPFFMQLFSKLKSLFRRLFFLI